MKLSTFLALPLLAGAALADTTAPAAPSAPTEQAAAPAEPQPPPYDDSAERAMYHNPLQAILAFVHDKASADAAAPRVRALTATPQATPLQASPESWLFLYFGSACFGSTELVDAMRPLLDADMARAEQFNSIATPFLNELCNTINTLAAKVEQVADSDSATHAAAGLKGLPDFMKDWGLRVDAAVEKAMPGAEFSRDDAYVFLALQQVRPLPAVDRLRRAFGHAQARTKGGFPALAEAMQEAWEPLESMTGVNLNPERLSPEALAEDERLCAAFGAWLDVAATISDKASADAAADWLEKQNAALGRSLVAAGFTATNNGGSRTALLGALMEATLSYFEMASPSFFGSEKLEQRLEVTPADYMPVPEVRPLQGEAEND